MVTRIQAIIAVAVPWLLAVVIVPDSAWAGAGVAVPLLFAALHARAWQSWLAPLSGVISVLPPVPWWLSLVAAAGVGALLMIRPPTYEGLAAGGSGRRSVLVIASVLITSGAVLAAGLVLQARQQDARFDASQAAAAQAWATATPEPDEMSSPDASSTVGLVGQPLEVQEEAAAPVQPPFARMRFVRKGTDAPVVTDRTLYVGPDVSERGLAAGPGHYPGTARPGKPGNMAIAGHRTGWGSPFLNLDDLEPGDRIKIVDRRGVRHTYVVRESRLVAPTDDWVLGPNPLGTGEPTLTLTTCDPPEINTDRLIVFATLDKSVQLPAT